MILSFAKLLRRLLWLHYDLARAHLVVLQLIQTSRDTREASRFDFDTQWLQAPRQRYRTAKLQVHTLRSPFLSRPVNLENSTRPKSWFSGRSM